MKLGLLDPMISQLVNQTLFESLAMNHSGAASHTNPPLYLPSSSLNFDEETFSGMSVDIYRSVPLIRPLRI